MYFISCERFLPKRYFCICLAYVSSIEYYRKNSRQFSHLQLFQKVTFFWSATVSIVLQKIGKELYIIYNFQKISKKKILANNFGIFEITKNIYFFCKQRNSQNICIQKKRKTWNNTKVIFTKNLTLCLLNQWRLFCKWKNSANKEKHTLNFWEWSHSFVCLRLDYLFCLKHKHKHLF